MFDSFIDCLYIFLGRALFIYFLVSICITLIIGIINIPITFKQFRRLNKKYFKLDSFLKNKNNCIKYCYIVKFYFYCINFLISFYSFVLLTYNSYTVIENIIYKKGSEVPPEITITFAFLILISICLIVAIPLVYLFKFIKSTVKKIKKAHKLS